VSPAGATGPVYPGETLTLTQGAPAVVGLETGFVAAGQQADVEDDPLGFDFAAFVKDASVDPACSPSFTEEQADSLSDPTEQAVTAPTLFQGTDATFSIPFKLNYGYAWLVSGRGHVVGHAQTLRVSRGLRARRLQCGVTASNAGGTATARSKSYRVR
jgi:hypothetical protein